MPDPDPSVIAIHIEPDRMDRRALAWYRAGHPAQRLLALRETVVLTIATSLFGSRIFTSEWRRAVGSLVVVMVIVVAFGSVKLSQLKFEVRTHRVDVYATDRRLTIIRLIGPTETIDWDDLSDITVTPTHLLARWSPVREVLLPRRCLADASQWDQLCEWATRSRARPPLHVAQPNQPTQAPVAAPAAAPGPANPRIWQRRRDVTR